MDKAIQIAYNEFFEIKCRLAADAGFDGIAVKLWKSFAHHNCECLRYLTRL